MAMGCRGKEAPRSTFPAKPAITPIDPTTAANIRGEVKLEGTAPAAKPIDMTADPGCRGANASETIGGENGGLGNVFVYIKGGVGDRAFAVPQNSVVIVQDGCRYRPHVVGVMTGQKIDFRNDDPTTHNIHASAQFNREWNESQPPQAPMVEKIFESPEIMLAVKCNQHPWMRMYVNVVSHPFYAVSGSDGHYEISGLPPGNYTLAFVHEKLGEQDVAVALAAHENKTVDTTFKQP
jgi:plastocyanin